ncbi:YheC/YheD family protein [Evansella tamaricis]|uniref:YheC/YheD family protein n=1 Tax=Evansella tamaricis TaxID=2069301 RepID=A0ABS6JC74_9BACI|nr:YheC/YheD family protein [Evansella tamaricis]MBU9711282.1 YheC/YheD family protein [Evansella tamaricis]
MLKSIRIRCSETEINSFILSIPENDLNEVGLEDGSQKTIVFGIKRVECTVLSSGNQEKNWTLSKAAWSSLAIPFPLTLMVQNDGENSIFLGPVIGIYTAGFTGNSLRPVGERSFLFSKYIYAAKSLGGLAFIFGSHHIHWNEGIIEGYTFRETGWEQVKIPLPNVVYDRLPNRRTESLPIYSEVKERLEQEYDIPWFNPGFFDKWHIYQQLIDIPEAQSFLPRTISSPSEKEIQDFIHSYEHVYIKPKNGSLGLGIHQIVYDSNEKFYYCRFRDHSRNRLRRYGSLSRLLKTQFPRGFETLVIQEGISLLKYQNNPIDFRIHTNKDEHGVWKISAIAAKIAGSGSVTTHVKSGGHVKSVSEIWEDLHLTKSLLVELKKATYLLSKAIDDTTEGYVGEIGFDIGIDQQEKIWMFEANSKPGRTIFSHPKLKQDDLLTRKMPMEYAFHLYRSSIDISPIIQG